MSGFDSPPTNEDILEFEPGEFDQYMAEIYKDLTMAHRVRARHDRNAYFCDEAGSEKCRALGHKAGDESHSEGWSGEEVCGATRYQDACSECEGECSEATYMNMGTRSEFWGLFELPNRDGGKV